MAKKDIIGTREIPALYFVRHITRTDLDYFALNLHDLTKEIKASTNPASFDIYEVKFWQRKPEFKKLTKAQRKSINLL
jgi:hypothetical protein